MGQINLSWPANPAAEQITKYTVWQSRNAGAFSLVSDTVVPSLLINGPLPGVYQWKVTATNLVGTSDFGPVADGPSAPTPPGVVTVVVS